MTVAVRFKSRRTTRQGEARNSHPSSTAGRAGATTRSRAASDRQWSQVQLHRMTRRLRERAVHPVHAKSSVAGQRSRLGGIGLLFRRGTPSLHRRRLIPSDGLGRPLAYGLGGSAYHLRLPPMSKRTPTVSRETSTELGWRYHWCPDPQRSAVSFTGDSPALAGYSG